MNQLRCQPTPALWGAALACFLQVTDVTAISVSLGWSNPAVHEYDVWRKTGGGAFVFVGTAGPVSTYTDSDPPSGAPDVAPSTTYTYRVVQSFSGRVSNEVTVTTPAA